MHNPPRNLDSNAAGGEQAEVSCPQDTNALLQQIAGSALDGVVVYGPDMRYQVWNPAMEGLSGRSADEVLGRHPREIFPHLEAVGMVEALAAILAGAPPVSMDYEYQDSRTGQTRWVSDTCSPLKNEQGHVTGVIGMVRDITAYKRLESELRQTQERFRSLFENAPLGYQSLDEQGNFIELNDTWCRVLGYSKGEVLGRNFAEFLHPDYREVFKENFPKFKSLGYVLGVEFEMVRKDGSTVLVSFDGKIGRDADGAFKQTHCVLQDITQRRRSEETLGLMAEMLDSAPGSITVHDLQGRFVYVNQKTFELHGYSKEEFLEMNLHELDVPESAERIQERMRLIQEKGEASFEVRHFRKDGSTFPLEVFAKQTTWADKPALLSIATDITERRRAEQALRQSEERFSKAFKNNPAWLTIVHLQTQTVLEVNDEWVKVFGFSREEAIGRTTVELGIYNPETYHGILEEIKEKLSVRNQELVAKTRTGGERIIMVSREIIEIGDEQYLLAMGTDITEQRQAEQALREKIKELDRYFTNSLDLLCIADTHGHFLRLNPEWEKVLGYSITELEGQVFLDFVHPDDIDSTVAILGNLKNQEQVLSFENRYRHKDGSYRWIEWRAKPIGSTIYAAARDVTDRRNAEKERQRLQAQLFQSQKMEAIGHLAGGMAHDFNNMLGVILSAAELAKMDIGENSPAQEELQAIKDAVLRARDLTMKLLTFARRDKIDVKGVAIQKIIGDLQGILIRTVPKSIDLRINIKDRSVVNCDGNQIQQALVNVCNNAVDAMPVGGTLAIEAKEMEFTDYRCPQCGKILHGRYCLIQISDTGAGMIKDTLSRITEPFYTTKGIGKGTGLGLSVTLGIVHSHNGHLHIYSEPGRGTCVKIYLPIEDESDAPHEARSDAAPLTGTETILVVDDEQALLHLAGKMLSRNGYKPLLANGGEEAVALYKQHGDGIAAVVLDLMMPNMDGAQVCARLKELNPEVKVVFSSGFSSDGVAATLLDHENRKFVQKPFEITTLCRTIRNIIDNGN